MRPHRTGVGRTDRTGRERAESPDSVGRAAAGPSRQRGAQDAVRSGSRRRLPLGMRRSAAARRTPISHRLSDGGIAHRRFGPAQMVARRDEMSLTLASRSGVERRPAWSANACDLGTRIRRRRAEPAREQVDSNAGTARHHPARVFPNRRCPTPECSARISRPVRWQPSAFKPRLCLRPSGSLHPFAVTLDQSDGSRQISVRPSMIGLVRNRQRRGSFRPHQARPDRCSAATMGRLGQTCDRTTL